MEMILGIVIGLVIWQVVIFVLQWLQMEDTPWSCPIPYLGLLLVEFIILCWEGCVNLRVWLYCASLGKNPFKTSIAEFCEMPLEQREKIVELAHPKYRNKLARMLKTKPNKMNQWVDIFNSLWYNKCIK